jgi:hypothetical protein
VRGEKEIKSMQKEKIGDVIFFLDCKEDRSEDLCAKEKKTILICYHFAFLFLMFLQ